MLHLNLLNNFNYNLTYKTLDQDETKNYLPYSSLLQTLSQYLKQHENAYLDRDSQATEPSEIFHQVERVPPPSPMPRENNNNNNGNNNNGNNNGGGGNGHKRPYPLADGYYETGYAADLEYQQPCIKRPNLSYAMPFMYHHPHLQPQEPPPPPPVPPPPSHPYNILPLLQIREAEDHKGHVEDEWKNIHVVSGKSRRYVTNTGTKGKGGDPDRIVENTNFKF